MTPGASEGRLNHFLSVGREYLTHWAIAGTIITLTGFAPDHWVADLLSHLSIPESLRHGWLPAFDIRIGLVTFGVVIIAWDVLRRSRRQFVETPTLAHTALPLALPDKPSIAVLPFQNMSGDPEQEYFADGMVEDIITALSRFQNLFVIARNSSFTYKGQTIDIKQVGRELGVRYVLEGSVRKSANRVRITGQLIDAPTGAHLWADRFDGTLEHIFDLQDQITTSIVGAIAPRLEQAEIERAKRISTDNMDAYDSFLRGIASVHRVTRDSNEEALKWFYKAIEIDPGFAAAHGLAAWCFGRRMANGWMLNREKRLLKPSGWPDVRWS